ASGSDRTVGNATFEHVGSEPLESAVGVACRGDRRELARQLRPGGPAAAARGRLRAMERAPRAVDAEQLDAAVGVGLHADTPERTVEDGPGDRSVLEQAGPNLVLAIGSDQQDRTPRAAGRRDGRAEDDRIG